MDELQVVKNICQFGEASACSFQPGTIFYRQLSGSGNMTDQILCVYLEILLCGIFALIPRPAKLHIGEVVTNTGVAKPFRKQKISVGILRCDRALLKGTKNRNGNLFVILV